eukprot:TRINITY_DN11334_c0_g1_i1.p1 TRINITY_DN11334_c0_g1~~TRINITY_DN11334_c0_g1_i1.p1  ORF type:complete len:167 (-),score=49.36 TRINITY_DN11334_c0_g1_i1:81-581(-)
MWLCSRLASPCGVARTHLRLPVARQLPRQLHVTPVLCVETVEEIRRRMSAATEAQKFRRELAEPDRIIGRAYAELEEERKRKLEWKARNGLLSEREKEEMAEELEQCKQLGIDPSKGRYSDFLKKKRFVPKEKKGMPEFRAGASMQSALAKVKHAKSLKKKRKHNR